MNSTARTKHTNPSTHFDQSDTSHNNLSSIISTKVSPKLPATLNGRNTIGMKSHSIASVQPRTNDLRM